VAIILAMRKKGEKDFPCLYKDKRREKGGRDHGIEERMALLHCPPARKKEKTSFSSILTRKKVEKYKH